MKMLTNKNIYLAGILLLFMTNGCNKYLDKKPNQALVDPSSLEDCLAIMDNQGEVNIGANTGIGEGSADNYYLTNNDYSSLTYISDKSIYLWGNEIFYDNPPFQNEWAKVYGICYKANVVLHTLDKIDRNSNRSQYDNTKGMAYFLRGYAHQIIARNFAKAYNSADAASTPGIPLNLTINFNEKQTRATVEKTYEQIISDLKTAVRLLPDVAIHVMRPSRPAAYGLLSRVYLSMNNYKQAELYADSCLQLKGQLMNYNSDPSIGSGTFPFNRFNTETLFYAAGGFPPILYNRARIDSDLIKLYEENDLRKTLYFKNNTDGSKSFVGNYTASAQIFIGLATDEIYLTRAEAKLFNYKLQEAKQDLNYVLQNRFKTGSFEPITTIDDAIVLKAIRNERRKELLMRDLRWMDIKRINTDGIENITIKRTINNTNYTLPPNSNKFALPFPSAVIQLSGMEQNPR